MKIDPREKQVLPKLLTSQAPGSKRTVKPSSDSYFLVPAPILQSHSSLNSPSLCPSPCKSPCFLRTGEVLFVIPLKEKAMLEAGCVPGRKLPASH